MAEVRRRKPTAKPTAKTPAKQLALSAPHPLEETLKDLGVTVSEGFDQLAQVLQQGLDRLDHGLQDLVEEMGRLTSAVEQQTPEDEEPQPEAPPTTAP